jgi:hypothetical protein
MLPKLHRVAQTGMWCRPAQRKKQDLFSKITNTQKRADGATQVQGPEFNPEYC